MKKYYQCNEDGLILAQVWSSGTPIHSNQFTSTKEFESEDIYDKTTKKVHKPKRDADGFIIFKNGKPERDTTKTAKAI